MLVRYCHTGSCRSLGAGYELFGFQSKNQKFLLCFEEESISSDLESRFAVKKLQFFKRASSDLQLPLRQWGASNFYLLVLSKGKQLKPPRQWGFQHCRNGVVDHLAGPSEGLKIQGCQYYLVGIICHH